MAKRQRKKKSKKPKSLNNPHDKLFKTSFSMRSVIVGYLTEVFPKKYGEKLDLETLERDNTSYISKDMEETTSDLVWRCRLKTGRIIMLSFLFEHKSYKPKRPHLQLGVYQFGAYMVQDLANPNIPLVQVVPIMVYHGLEGWEFIEPFETYFGEIDPEFMRFLPCSDFILTNIQSYPDEVIHAFNVRFLEKTFLAFKNFLNTTYIQSNFGKLWLTGYEGLDNDEKTFFIDALGIYLSVISGFSEAEVTDKVKQILRNTSNKEEMVATERFLANIKKEGRQEGRQEGKEIIILDIYQKTGWSAHQIADITSFSVEYIQSVIDKFEKKDD